MGAHCSFLPWWASSPSWRRAMPVPAKEFSAMGVSSNLISPYFLFEEGTKKKKIEKSSANRNHDEEEEEQGKEGVRRTHTRARAHTHCWFGGDHASQTQSSSSS